MVRVRWSAVIAAAVLLGAFAVPSGALPASGATPPSTVWLCRPGERPDPCTADLTATVVRADGSKRRQSARAAANPPIDCFYVYPTVSRQRTANANLTIDPEETAVARAQASRFSQVCRVYAPMYPQLTLSTIGLGGRRIDPAAVARAYVGVASAWQDYLAHDNHGRRFVLIGHSQGAAMLIALIRRVIDPDPALRARLVSALVLGGNVTVPAGQDVGGDFQHVPACRSASQTGCVVAYSSFGDPPPADSLFGRVSTSIAVQSGVEPATAAGLQVLCTNPAALGGGAGALQPYFLTRSLPGLPAASSYGTGSASTATPWVTYPGLYQGRCESANGANWLQVTATSAPNDGRPVVQQVLGPRWGLHLVDVNIALGNLVQLVRDEVRAQPSR
jgi:hypothetical protein